MCYTCTYSLCKGCTKDADYVRVRGNKGLCGICIRTIKLIENSAQGNKASMLNFFMSARKYYPPNPLCARGEKGQIVSH